MDQTHGDAGHLKNGKSNGKSKEVTAAKARAAKEKLAQLGGAVLPGAGIKKETPVFRKSDTGNAEMLAHLFKDRVRYVPAWDEFLIHVGTHWKRDTKELHLLRFTKKVIEELTDDVWQKKSQEQRARLAMIRLTKAEMTSLEPDELDSDPMLFGVRNGIVDLRTGKLQEHRAEDLITKLAPVDFDPKAKAPRWEKYLREVLPDEEVRDYLQRVFGYALCGETGERVLVVLVGLGKNGKSVLLKTIQTVMGPYARTTAPELLMVKDHSAHPTEIASLLGVRLAISSEIKKGRTFDEEQLKRLTGNDRLSAHRMREDWWEFNPTHKIVVASNHRPRVRDTTDSFWDRVRLVQFNVRIKKEDPELGTKMLIERSGIFNWLLEGHRKYRERRLAPPDAVMAATKAYRVREDIIGQFFSEHCEFDNANDITTSAELLRSAKNWAETNNYRPPNGNAIAERLEEYGCVGKHRENGNVWLGVRLRKSKKPENIGKKNG